MAENSGYKEYLAGLTAGLATVIVGHPFDTVKVKLQKHNTEAQGIKYKNGLQCAARILRNDGLRGLYCGGTPSFVGIAIESSLFFGMYSQMKETLQERLQTSGPHPLVVIPSAAWSGALISFILCPSELVKCRMQVQGTDSLNPKSRRYSGPLDCAIKIVKGEGITGIFRGGISTLLRESLGNTIFFSTYEYVRHFLHLKLKGTSYDSGGLTDVGIGIISGGLGGVSFWSVVFPFDVAKTIIQTDLHNSCNRNPFRVLHTVYSRTGLRGCYTGLSPTVLRAFPANAAAIVVWEFAAKMLGLRRE